MYEKRIDESFDGFDDTTVLKFAKFFSINFFLLRIERLTGQKCTYIKNRGHYSFLQEDIVAFSSFGINAFKIKLIRYRDMMMRRILRTTKLTDFDTEVH